MSPRTITPWLAPVPAIALGALVASMSGVSPLAFAPNVAAALLGGAACLALARRPATGDAAVRLAPWLALALVAASFLGPNVGGVHRWLALGPLRLNASAALAPWLLLGFASGAPRVRERTVVAAVAAQLLHLGQPDAGQATALALGLAPVLVSPRLVRPRLGLPALLILLCAAALAWTRPDGLPPVAHVERILWLALEQGPAVWAGALLALLAALLPLAWPIRPGDAAGRALAAGASLYFVGSIVATFVGDFPVPLLGAGAAPVLGWYGLLSVARPGWAARSAGVPPTPVSQVTVPVTFAP